MEYQYQVDRHENTIIFKDMSHPYVVGDFIRQVYEGSKRGYQEFNLDFSKVLTAFPNACTPISGLLDYYVEKIGLTFDFTGVSDFLNSTSFNKPLIITNENLNNQISVMNTVWKFSSTEQIFPLHKKYIQEISRAAECEEGVIEALEWSLYEVMDNVLQHSRVESGYVMGQIHTTSKHIAFCVYDTGIGIFNSLKPTHYSPRNCVDAITLAIKEGVTRDPNNGQGNGLWGLHDIVRSNSGMLSITSGSGYYGLQGNDIRTSDRVPYLSRENDCTVIDFQLDIEHPILRQDYLGGIDLVNTRIEALEDENENIIYKLSDQATGTGTRQSGSMLRTELINLSKESKAVIAIDFSDISTVSSSFADELVGKLMAHYGITSFMQAFRLLNMNDFVRSIVDRSVSQRMGEIYKPK
ncbi:STAS-like domain-containing protein [Nodosilinea nodulosa]|uniref:STAS-like domain-containing protein n=1 Tax=Nodosilinea nodulosa TaxID=416001 RepID=UPI0002E20A2E|nr:STAS-like domain-containing protein [Nodosilinea nodulosa]